MKKIFTLVLAICAVSVILGGCSGGDKAADPAAPSTDKPAEEAK
jgi:hypothetical protein